MDQTALKPRDKLEAIGIDWVCEQLEDGRSQREIAKQVGVNVMTMNDWLHSTPLQSARARAAMEAGAEAHESRAIAILEEAREEIRADPQLAGSITMLARERAQAAWRQASVRSPRYSDRRSVDIAVTHKHDVQQISTQELERLVDMQRQTLQLEDDGSVTQGGYVGIQDGGGVE